MIIKNAENPNLDLLEKSILNKIYYFKKINIKLNNK